ncbi:NAD-dependent deacetylase hst3 [Dimargaris cristalligena]|nr:NAD-dependent deacetylase hst3 [Dimargaris cristalligena]
MTQYIPFSKRHCTCSSSRSCHSDPSPSLAAKARYSNPKLSTPAPDLPTPSTCLAHSSAARLEIEKVAKLILASKRCVVVSGAGISCSAGIPDFRSSSGLFSTLKEQHGNHINQGRDLFDAQLFNSETTTRIFHQFIGQFKQSIENVQPTPTHQFLSWLHSQGRLTRWYTQNIDGLEAKTGLSVLGQLRAKPSLEKAPVGQDELDYFRFTPSDDLYPDPTQRTLPSRPARSLSPESLTSSDDGSAPASPQPTSTPLSSRIATPMGYPSPCTPSRISRDHKSTVVPLHGDLDQLVCPLCSTYYPFTPAFFSSYQQGEAPICPHCAKLNDNRLEAGRRPISVGKLRPNIVLYNEPHPSGELIAKVMNTDVRLKPDLLLILGTRLNVHGCKALVKAMARTVRQQKHGKIIMVNLDPIQSKEWDDLIDIQVLGPADDLIRDIIRVRDSQTCLTQFWGSSHEDPFHSGKPPASSPITDPDTASRPAPTKRAAVKRNRSATPTPAPSDVETPPSVASQPLPKLKRTQSHTERPVQRRTRAPVDSAATSSAAPRTSRRAAGRSQSVDSQSTVSSDQDELPPRPAKRQRKASIPTVQPLVLNNVNQTSQPTHASPKMEISALLSNEPCESIPLMCLSTALPLSPKRPVTVPSTSASLALPPAPMTQFFKATKPSGLRAQSKGGRSSGQPKKFNSPLILGNTELTKTIPLTSKLPPMPATSNARITRSSSRLATSVH